MDEKLYKKLFEEGLITDNPPAMWMPLTTKDHKWQNYYDGLGGTTMYLGGGWMAHVDTAELAQIDLDEIDYSPQNISSYITNIGNNQEVREERPKHTKKDNSSIMRLVIIITLVVIFILLAFVQFQNRRTANRIINETKIQLADIDRVYKSKCNDLPKNLYNEAESSYTFTQAKEKCIEMILPVNQADVRESIVNSQIKKYNTELEQKGALHKYTNLIFSILFNNPLEKIHSL